MDQIIVIVIALLLIAIMIGSLRRGIQSLISFALLGLLITLLLARLPGQGLSFAFGLFGDSNETEAPISAVKAFDNFVQNSGVPELSANGTQPLPPDDPGPDEPTGVSPTAPPQDDSISPASPDNTQIGDVPDDDIDNTMTGNDSSGSAGVRAWW